MLPRLLLAAAAALFAHAASAETLHITWSKPAGPVSGYNLYQGATAAEATSKANKIVNGGALNSPDLLYYDLVITPPGTYYFAMDTWYCDAAGCAESAATPAVAYTVAAPAPPPATVPPPANTPQPPTNLKIVTVATVAYDLTKANDKLALKAIGTVPLGTACLPGMTSLGMDVIPRAKAVLPAGATRPQVVLAKCS